jgi:phosphonate transport system substrate-binding protein
MPESRRTFGVVPHVNDDATWGALGEVCRLVGDDARIEVQPHFASSPATLAAAIEHGDVHFAWVSPTLLLLSEHLGTAVPLLSAVRQGTTFFHALLFVAAGSPIHAVEDMAGRSVAWVARTSASGYIVPRLGLARRGIDLHGFFGRELMCDSHAAVAWRVLRGEADIGATYGVFERGDPSRPLVKSGFGDFVPELEARVVGVNGPIHSDMIVADPRVPTTERAAFAGALARLSGEPLGAKAVRTVMGADEFRPFSPQAVSELAELIAAGRSSSAL